MIKGKNLPNNLWAEAISTIVYLKNRSPTKYLEHKTPYEAFYGYKLVVSHLKFFGSKAFSHIPKEYRRKLDAKVVKCIFIGYCVDHKAYKMYDPITHKVFASRDVIFHEYADEVQKEVDVWKVPEEGIESEKTKKLKINRLMLKIKLQATKVHQERLEQLQSSETLHRSTRKIQTPIRYKYYALMTQVMSVEEPLNFEQAKDHKEWMSAMQEEYDSIMKMILGNSLSFLKIKFLSVQNGYLRKN
jgi:hypothetical protein